MKGREQINNCDDITKEKKKKKIGRKGKNKIPIS
jgi:hypothetical protein